MSAASHEGTAFDSPGRYVIFVRGEVPARWSERMDDVTAHPLRGRGDPEITVLECEFVDQAALTGVLNMLYELHLTLLSVQCLGIDVH
jgi:hypothetical protein